MAMSTTSGGGVKAEPNVTPMIDVMLVLLIIFMIVIPAINSGFNAQPPQGVNLKPHPEEDQDQVLGIDGPQAGDGRLLIREALRPETDADLRKRQLRRRDRLRDDGALARDG